MQGTREKLIELLRSVYGTSHNAPYFREHELEPLADHLIANGVTVQKWISVKERLPEYAEPVMGWDAELRDMGIVNFIYGQFFDIVDMSEVNVTHWMPLPEPPKGE